MRRGDAGTVRAHLEALEPETRALYAMLAREALALAQRAGLEEAWVAEVRAALVER